MSVTTTASSTAPKSIPQPPKSTARACNGNADLSSSPGSIRSSKSSKLGHTPPYWNRRNRSVSNVSYISINAPTRRPPILLEDHTEAHHESNNGLWARGVKINDYHVVSGSAIGAGSYVVWHCLVETLEGRSLEIRKRYSEFDTLRARIVQTFPHSVSAVPVLPPKSVVSRFRTPFLERRREGLQFFLNCVLLNPEFAGSPVLKEFIFS